MSTSGARPRGVLVGLALAILAAGAAAQLTPNPVGGPVQKANRRAVEPIPAQPPRILLSLSPVRSDPAPLAGQSVAGDVYVFVQPAPATVIQSVAFHLDDARQLGPPVQVENVPPFDLGGTAGGGDAQPFDTTTLADGWHRLTAVVQLSGGPRVVLHAGFTTVNDQPALQLDQSAITLFAASGRTVSAPVQLTVDTPPEVAFEAVEEAAWLIVAPEMEVTPITLTVEADATRLLAGTYVDTVQFTAPGATPAELTVTLVVDGGSQCAPLPCEEILVSLPLLLDFDGDDGGIVDGAGVGTGLTYVDPTSSGQGYLPGLLQTGAGELVIRTTSGIQYAGHNSLDNALGVGIDAPSQVTILETTLLQPPAGTGGWEQAGLWFGNDEDAYVKLVFASAPGGTLVQMLLEVDGATASSATSSIPNPAGQDVHLRLRVDPFTQQISGDHALGGGPWTPLHVVFPPSEFFSFDAAGIDPAIGTRSFGGLFATHRNGPAPLDYRFGDLSLTAGEVVVPPGEVDVVRTTFPMDDPTSLAWGPDGRLYALGLYGDLRAFTLDGLGGVLDEAVITALVDAHGPRLALGLTLEPDTAPGAVPGEVVLWVAHSNPSLGSGELNSGMVSRLSGPGFATVEDRITGLPRAIANHSVNSLHFGPDGRLYIVVGGNTGAGAPNLAATEFGDRAEQPLSAALVVADVFAPGFDGTCANDTDPLGPAPCDVTTWATGLRNTYDFLFHSNGQVYAPDNGLGVTGTFPPSPTAPCFGLADPTPVSQGGHNPGTQLDPLNRLTEGGYYGHPNPSRGECVFGDGSLQGVPPDPAYEPHFFVLGNHKSANGIVEYPADVGCVPFAGDLLIANYSSGDDLTRVRLAPDGLSVVDASSLVGGFSNPLPLCVSPDGRVFVGEFGGDVISVLRLLSRGCWEVGTPRPDPVLDAGGAALDGLLYAVGGKTTAGHVSTVAVHDPVAQNWTTVADLPGPAVENAAVVALDGKLWVVGGSTGPFSGAVASLRVFDPATNTWDVRAPMSAARGGPAAAVLDGRIHVVGGMDGAGASLASAEVYDPATDTWSPLPDMAVRRDNPGAVAIGGGALGGELLVFGGRTRDADGTEVDGTLSSVEAYDPVAGAWSGRPSMPTGRRALVAAVLDGKAIVAGGERTPSGGAFDAVEEYDPATATWRVLTPMPTARHGAAGGVIGGRLYIAGGGPSGGSSYTTVTESFGY